ncbi:hypothetical protein [Nesterenkonia alba]|uniref:hypothetical protein n=1 Tax=Nesterenkonia alba TaxID=515814 RepID=UPI0003B3117A|nr:hypothetical protein [Nesterenkonia alba]
MRGLLKFLTIVIGAPFALFLVGATWTFMFYVVGYFAVEALALVTSLAVLGGCIFVGMRIFRAIDQVGVKSFQYNPANDADLVKRTENRALQIDEIAEVKQKEQIEKAQEQSEIDDLLAQVNKGKENSEFDVTAMYEDEYGNALDDLAGTAFGQDDESSYDDLSGSVFGGDDTTPAAPQRAALPHSRSAVQQGGSKPRKQSRGIPTPGSTDNGSQGNSRGLPSPVVGSGRSLPEPDLSTADDEVLPPELQEQINQRKKERGLPQF